MTTAHAPQRRDFARAKLAATDFVVFCEFVHSIRLSDHMKYWASILTSPLPEHRRVAIAAPPEYWKSRLLRMFIEWSIGREPEWARCLGMNTESQAQKQVMSVQDTILHNRRYRMVFPHVEPDMGKGWNKTTIYVKRRNSARPEPTLIGIGVQGPVQGFHFEEIFTDDLTDQQDVRSASTMEAQRLWIKGVLSDRLRTDESDMPIGHWFSIFTRWGENDLWPTFTDPKDETSPDGGLGFTAIQMPAIKPDGLYPWGSELLWPEGYSHERLKSIRASKGVNLFAMTFLCNPAAMGGNTIETGKILRFNITAAPQFKYVLHSWDCASGDSQDASWTVMEEWSVSESGYYLTHLFRERIRYGELKPMILRLRDIRRPNTVVIEDRGIGQSICDDLLAEGGMHELRRIDPKGSGDKIVRAQATASQIEGGRVYVPGGNQVGWVAEFLSELAAFPKGRFDDQVDAFSMALDFLRGAVRFNTSTSVSWMGRTSASPGGQFSYA